MPPRPLTAPRKQASQARSRATVDALVEATARILVRDGFDAASTNRIAEGAGVSVGSLYQYFPSKEALVAAVVERHRLELMRVARTALAQVAHRPLAAGVRALVVAAIEAHAVDPELHRVLAEQTPRAGLPDGVEVFDPENYGLFKSYLETHRDELQVADLDLAAFVCVTAVEALTHTAVLHRPEVLAGSGMDALIEETTRLILGYLR